MHLGPKIVRDGLVFGYDTGANPSSNFDHRNKKRRFFKGRNNTNYLSDGLSGYNVVQAANWNGATPSFTLGTSEFGTPIGSYNTSGTSYMYSHDYVLDDDLNTLSGQTVTFSIYLKRDGADSSIRMRVYDNVSGYTNSTKTVTNQFQRYTMTKTLGSSPTRIFVMIDNTGGGVIDFHSPQLEIGSQASPFVDGTRSSTQSLLDLTKSTTIDVSNVSFDSDGLPTFDGTDDYIDITEASQTLFDNNESHSFSLWLKKAGSNSGNYAYVYDRYGTYRCPGLLFGLNTNTLVVEWRKSDNTAWVYKSSGLSVETGVWNFVTVTINAPGAGTTKTIKVYLYTSSGLQTATMTSALDWNAGTDGNFVIGKSISNNTYFNGQIALVHTYNRVLSASEVQQNYKAYKNRFGI